MDWLNIKIINEKSFEFYKNQWTNGIIKKKWYYENSKNKKNNVTLFNDYNNFLLNELINKNIFENINLFLLNIIINDCFNKSLYFLETQFENYYNKIIKNLSWVTNT